MYVWKIIKKTMTIDKQKKVIAIQLRRMITMVLFALLIIIILLSHNLSILGLTKYDIALVITGIYFMSIIFESLYEFNFIYFSDIKKTLMLRYFSLSYLNQKKHSIEMPLAELSGFELKVSFYGMKQKLILYRKIKDKEAKYPPVSISILNKQEKEQLIAALNHYKNKV
jgi:hypothetical protein